MITIKNPTDVPLLIDGPVGKLELLVNQSDDEKNKPWGVICHPHPLFGGTMHNKIVTTLAKTYQNMGANTVRFNFRGVMRSEGEFNQGKGELEDLLAVVNWVREQYPQQDIWLAGFSFGAYIAAMAAMQVEAKKLVTVAPPVQNFPMQALPPILCSWVLVQGELDDVVPPKEVLAWAESREPKPIILRFPEAGHFFHGLLVELRVRIEEALKE
jgi:alpha/beta superfamily hydrolase